MAAKILFILKKREMTYDEDDILEEEKKIDRAYCISSGLRNSASFVVEMLNENGIETKLVEVIDNNCIDREVNLYKPTHVVIEAYWVVPEKFDILHKLHPNVQWIVRNHSEIPFLANEGIAVDWTLKYLVNKKNNVFIAPNSQRSFQDVKKMVRAAYGDLTAEYKVVYLPNYYPTNSDNFAPKKEVGEWLNVGCFGAIRPLKNQLVQAIAAIEFARKHGKKLKFHINVARVENNGNPVLKSLRGLFVNLPQDKFQLVEHGWLEHKDFLNLVSTMDIGMQASFTETFNIVAADFISRGIPMVTSSEVMWMPKYFHADHTNTEDIVSKMEKVVNGFHFWKKAHYALWGLKSYSEEAKRIWINIFKYTD